MTIQGMCNFVWAGADWFVVIKVAEVGAREGCLKDIGVVGTLVQGCNYWEQHGQVSAGCIMVLEFIFVKPMYKPSSMSCQNLLLETC